MIPKIFHHVWVGGEMPTIIKFYLYSWQKLHPDWEFKLYNNDSISEIENIQFFKERCPTHSSLSDFIRYQQLFKYGGVYIDADMRCLKNINCFLEREDVFVMADDWIVGSGIIGAKHNHPVLKKCLELFPRRLLNGFKDNKSLTCGPVILDEVCREHNSELLDSKLFYPVSFHNRFGVNYFQDFPESYGVHHWLNSWF